MHIGKGLTESQILALCSNNDIHSFHGTPHNWTSEVYGIGKHLRQYGYYPDRLPLYVHSDHGGPYLQDTVMPIDLNTQSPLILFHSPRYVNEFKKHSNKKCYVLPSPFVFYRRKNKINKNPDAVGTLAFVGHSTPLIDDTSEMENYINDIKSLPSEFQPVSVMIHYHDVNKGVHKIFLENEIPVYTAGNPSDYRFTERFYSIMKDFKYTTSNLPMSCLFYSVEMGIPHFLYGSKPKFINKGDENLPLGEYDSEKEYFHTREITKLFTGIFSTISEDQQNMVHYELGLYNSVSRLKVSYLLYKSLFKYLVKHPDYFTKVIRGTRRINVSSILGN